MRAYDDQRETIVAELRGLGRDEEVDPSARSAIRQAVAQIEHADLSEDVAARLLRAARDHARGLAHRDHVIAIAKWVALLVPPELRTVGLS